MQFYTVDSLIAAGKTHSAIRHAVAGVRAGGHFLFVVPSVRLLQQIAADCKEVGCSRVFAFHSEELADQTVTARVRHHLRDTDYSQGQIVIITAAAFERLRYIERRDAWHLIIDEEIDPLFHHRINLTENRDHLLRLLQITAYNAAYSALHASEDFDVESIAFNRNQDDITGCLSPVAGKLISPHWQMYATNEQLNRFRDPEQEKAGIDVFGLLSPDMFDGFASVTLMAACLTETILYRYLLSRGCSFTPHPVIKPRFTKYDKADLVSVFYAIDRPWSAKLRDQSVNGKRVIQHIADRALKELDSAQYVYLLNKSEGDVTMPEGVALPHLAHGLNAFSHLHNAIILAALNPPPAYFGFAADMAGLNSEEVRTAIYRYDSYQAAGRISIRDLNSAERKKIIVADRDTALWLAGQIGTPHIHKLAGPDIVPADGRRAVDKAKTQMDRKLDHQAKLKAELVAEMDRVNPSNDKLYPYRIPLLGNEPCQHGSLFEDKRAQVPFSNTRGLTAHDFRELLRELQSQVVAAKADCALLNPCDFDPNLAKTWRGNDNIVFLSGIWLDNDGTSDLTPKQFADMLNVPTCIFNSFSSTVESPRWRVWIPTTHLITPRVHDELVAQIRKMLIDRKLYGDRYIAKRREKDPSAQIKRHGFDEGKMVANSNFYLPCQAAAGPDASFFYEFYWENSLLNPYQWIDRSIMDHRPPTITKDAPVEIPDVPSVNQKLVETAIARWREHQPGTGNHAFFTLGASLKHAGLPFFEWQAAMHTEAYHAHGSHSMTERLADLKKFSRKIWS